MAMRVAGSHPSSQQERGHCVTHTHTHTQSGLSLSLTETRSRFKVSINATEEAWTGRSNKPLQHPHLQDFQMFYVCESTPRNPWLVKGFFNAPLHGNWSLSAFCPPPVRCRAGHINHSLRFLLPVSAWAHLIGGGSSSISGRNSRFRCRSPSILQPEQAAFLFIPLVCACVVVLSGFCWVSVFASVSVLRRTDFMKGFRLFYHLLVVMSLDVLYKRWQNPGWR